MRQMHSVSKKGMSNLTLRSAPSQLMRRDESLAAINLAALERPPGEQLSKDFFRSRTKVFIKKGDTEVSLNDFLQNADPKLEEGIPPNNDAITLVKMWANSVYPNCDKTGIDLIAKHLDQVTTGLGLTFAHDMFRPVTMALETRDPIVRIDTNDQATRKITLHYDDKNCTWFYEVSADIFLTQTETGVKNQITSVNYVYKITDSGFELVSLNYSNPLIPTLLEGNTPFDAFILMVHLTKTLDPAIKDEKLIEFLNDQHFPIAQWYQHFLTALLNNVPRNAFSENPRDLLEIFIAIHNAIRTDTASKAVENAFFSALFQTYSTFPGVDPAVLSAQMKKITKTDIDAPHQPFSLPVYNGESLVFTLRTNKNTLKEAFEKTATSPTSSPLGFLRAKVKSLDDALSPKASPQLQDRLKRACYEVKKAQIATALQYADTPNTGMPLLLELFSIGNTLGVTDEKLPLIPDVSIEKLGELYNNVPWNRENEFIRNLDNASGVDAEDQTTTFSDSEKMFYACREALTSPNSDTAKDLSTSSSLTTSFVSQASSSGGTPKR